MKPVLRVVLIFVYALAFIIPGYIYFVTNNALGSLIGTSPDAPTVLLTLFRLFGLYAFVLVWSQVMLGTLRIPLQRLFGVRILRMHIFLGTFSLLFALTHYLMFTIGNWLTGLGPLQGISSYLGPSFLYGYLGLTAFYLMVLTVLTGLLRNKPWLQNHWRKIHFINYAIFILAFFHSFVIGSEVQNPVMKGLYVFFGASYAVVSLYKWGYKRLLGR